MKNAYEMMLVKMSKFNEWERNYMVKLPVQKRLEQFSILYDLCIESQKETIERMHNEHLQSLIETKKIFKKAGEKRGLKRLG
ncbi:MAG: hypothetical protein JRJ27_19850 [Deltaproteobacteria bacterium]|nr:hypothetical protein [Deltaproteobacteria bacterium]